MEYVLPGLGVSARPRLLAVIPHPDDESYSAAGLLALASRAGWDVRVVCVSFGERGKRHDGGPAGREALAAARGAELAASCALLGAAAPVVWGLPDGGLVGVADGTARVGALWTALGPSLVVTLGADGAYGHPDHLAVHRWCVGAWEALARPCPLLFAAFPAGLFVPQWEKVRGMLGDPPSPPASALGGPAHYTVAIASVAGLKRAAIAAHQTQLPGGDPEAIFPPGIVAELMAVETYEDATGRPVASTDAMLPRLTG